MLDRVLDRERITKILFNLIKVGVCFIFFLPLFIHSHFFFPYIVPRNILFRIAVEIIFTTYLILAYLKPEYRPKFNQLSLAVVIYFGIIAIATFIGMGLYSSFWGNYERMGGLFHYLHLLMYFFVLFNTFKEKKDWHSLLTFSIFVSLLMCFIGYAQWLKIPFLLKSSGGERLSGTLGNAIYLAVYILFHLFFLLYLLAKEKRFDLKLFSLSFLVFDVFLVISSNLNKLFLVNDWGTFNFFKAPILSEALGFPNFYLPYLILQILILAVWSFRSKKYSVSGLLAIIFSFELIIFYNTQTRGAIIGFFGGLFFLLIVSLFLSLNKKIKIIVLIIILANLLLPIFLFLGKNTSFVQSNSTLDRLTSISLTDVTTQSRLATWKASWQGWTDSSKTFLIGLGPENYYYAFNKYFPAVIYRDTGSQIWFDRAHNVIFDVGLTTGIIGLISYLSILALAAWALFKNYKVSKSISSSWLLISLLIAYFVQNFFVFDNLSTEILFYLLIGFIVFLKQSEKESGREKIFQAERPADVNYLYLSILALVLIFGIGLNIKTAKANNYLFQAIVIQPQNNQEISAKLDLYKKAINEAVTGRFEARQQLASFAMELVQGKESFTIQESEVINYAMSELEKSVKEEPLNIRHQLFLAAFYDSIVRFDPQAPKKAIEILEPGAALSPTRPQVYFELGQAYAFLGNLNKTIEFFRKGVELSPTVIDSRMNLLTLYIVSENFKLADEEFAAIKRTGWEPSADEYNKIINAYSRVQKYDKMIELAEKLLAIDKTAVNYARLAALYAKAGDNKKAEEAVQQAVGLDQNFAAEAKVFLEKLKKGELLEKSN